MTDHLQKLLLVILYNCSGNLDTFVWKSQSISMIFDTLICTSLKKKMKYRNQVKSKGFNVPCKQGNQGHILPDKVFQLHRRARMLNLLCLAEKRIFSCYIFSEQCSNKNTSFLENHETVKKYLHYHRTP